MTFEEQFNKQIAKNHSIRKEPFNDKQIDDLCEMLENAKKMIKTVDKSVNQTITDGVLFDDLSRAQTSLDDAIINLQSKKRRLSNDIQ